MKWTWLAVLMLGLLIAGKSFSQDSVPLNKLDPVSRELAVINNQFSIADQIYSGGFACTSYSKRDRYSVYNISAKYNRLEGWIGIADSDDKNARDRHYEIKVDGNSVLDGTISYGDRPVHMDLDVTGARSLHITLGPAVYIGDPVLLRGMPQ